MAVSIIPAMLMVALLFQAPQTTPPAPVIAPGPTDFALTPKGAAQNWPMFRGPQASGVADAQGALVEWDVKAGKNIRWKTPIPGFANSSPVIWGNRIFLSVIATVAVAQDEGRAIGSGQAARSRPNDLRDRCDIPGQGKLLDHADQLRHCRSVARAVLAVASVCQCGRMRQCLFHHRHIHRSRLYSMGATGPETLIGPVGRQ